ncbi:MAG: ribonuclease III [Pyrinomonadaceae bacterium]
MPEATSKLEKRLNYKFSDHSILLRALTHRSWAFENMEAAGEESIRLIENETLEFVGDSVLGLAIAEELFQTHEELGEGDLTLMKHHLVSTDMLAKIAVSLDLGAFLRVGKGEEKTGGRRKQALLANTVEAVIAAIFFDGGYLEAKRVIIDLFADELREVTPRSSLDFKTLLQETLQAKKLSAPRYEVTKTDGPSHKRVFTVSAFWQGGSTSGRGSSIKAAEMEAASVALEIIESGGTGPGNESDGSEKVTGKGST